MKGINLRQVRDFLDEIHLTSRYDDNGNLEVVFGASEEFVYDIVIIISTDNDRLSYFSFAPGYTPRTADPFRLANSHNRRCYMPVCVVRGEDEHIDFEYSYLLDEEVSEEFVRENCVVMPIRCILRSFADLEKEYQP